MSSSTHYIQKWIAQDSPSGDSKVAVSARIPFELNLLVERLTDEFDISKTDALIACIDVGVNTIFQDWQDRTDFEDSLHFHESQHRESSSHQESDHDKKTTKGKTK